MRQSDELKQQGESEMVHINRPVEGTKNITVVALEKLISDNKGKPLEVTVAAIFEVVVKDPQTQEDKEKLSMHFGEIDGFRLLLNDTNTTTMFDKYGNETDKWEGKKITVFMGSYRDNANNVCKGVRVKV
ncbi:MAG: hypothetical protein KAJ03_10850 [Gammaproteobacteria bacterium]|nr:hypothetical protein [Gammaproteobacteria bacterium]